MMELRKRLPTMSKKPLKRLLHSPLASIVPFEKKKFKPETFSL